MISFQTDPGLACLPGIRHGFFGRSGGVSRGVYESLNCCWRVRGDLRGNVSANRDSVATALGASPGSLLTLFQRHTAKAMEAVKPWEPDMAPGADAIVTRQNGVPVGVLTADCVPVLLADPKARVVAAVHAGWRGALAGVIATSVARMLELGANQPSVRAAIGPAISRASYEVGEEFRERFLDEDPESTRLFSLGVPNGRLHFDLPGYVRLQLARAGIADPGVVRGCTFAEETRYFSYRRRLRLGEGDCGRQVSIILLTP